MKTVPFNNPPENFSYPCGEYRVFRITPSDPESFKFLPKLHVRALEFVERYGSETDPVWLAQLLHNNFKNPQTESLVHILIAVDAAEKIAAHMISYVESYGKLGAVAMLLQLEIDKPVDAAARRQMHNLSFNLMKEWARGLKLKTVLAYIIRPAMARLVEVDNFYQYRVVMRHDLESDPQRVEA